MPKKIQKSLQDYLSSIKKANPKFHFPNPPNVSLSSKKWILWGCKHPKTLSFAVGRTQNDDSATLSDIDRFLFENFSSLYTRDNDVVQKGDPHHSKNDNLTGVVLFESPRLLDTPPNLRGTHRFFVNPGISGSLIEEARASNSSSSSSTNTTTTTTTTMDSNDVVCPSEKTTSFSVETQHDEDYDGDDSDLGLESPGLPEQCVAVLASSRRPYDDFRRSMEEMVGARLRRRESVDWGFMEELLLCYLNLNEKRSHKYVLGAFVDLVVDLRNRGGSDRVAPAPAPVPVPARSRKGVRTGARERGVRRRRRARDQLT